MRFRSFQPPEGVRLGIGIRKACVASLVYSAVAEPSTFSDSCGKSALPGGRLVGVIGFEPTTPSSRTRCATRLRYTPTEARLIAAVRRGRKHASRSRVPMANETKTLAEYAANLRFADLPDAVVQRAKDCIADTVAVIAFGAALPWSRIVLRYAGRMGARRQKPRAAARRGAAACADGRVRQRRAGARLRDGQPDVAEQRRASRRHDARACSRGGAGARHRRARAAHRIRRRRRDDDPDRAGDQAQQRRPRLSRAGHHRAVRRRGRGRAADEVRRRQDDERAWHRRLAGLRAPGVRAVGHRRDGEAHAHGPRRGERRAGGGFGGGRFHWAVDSPGGAVRLSQRLLRRKITTSRR